MGILGKLKKLIAGVERERERWNDTRKKIEAKMKRREYD